MATDEQAVALPPYTFRIPSERPAGHRAVDQIWLTFYPAQRSNAPAVVIVHSLGEGRKGFIHRRLHRMAGFLAKEGIAAAVMELPYHMRRLPRGVSPLRLYTGSGVETVGAFDQAADDVSTVAAWLRKAPGVDANRIGVVGLSLGAIITHLAMGRDPSLSTGVAIMGGGDVESLRHKSALVRLFHPRPPPLTGNMRTQLDRIEPLTFGHVNRPRRVLMIQAARDFVIPPSNAAALWEALGRPPIRWVDTNHFGLLLGSESVAKAALGYLKSVWSGAEAGKETIPPISAPTLKAGFLTGLDSAVTLSIQWQAVSLYRRRDHLSLGHLNFGFSGRGFFAGAGATVNPWLDVGIGRRLNSRFFRPYVSLHLVF